MISRRGRASKMCHLAGGHDRIHPGGPCRVCGRLSARQLRILEREKKQKVENLIHRAFARKLSQQAKILQAKSKPRGFIDRIKGMFKRKGGKRQ